MSVQMIPASLVNEVVGCRSSVIEPKVGMCCTYFIGSDRYGYVVSKVISPKKIEIISMNDNFKMHKYEVDGIEYVDENVVTDYVNLITKTEDDTIAKYNGTDEEWRSRMIQRDRDSRTYTLRKNGRWVQKGDGLWDGGGVHLGVEETYLDPSF